MNVDLHIDFEAEHPTFYSRRYSYQPSMPHPSILLTPVSTKWEKWQKWQNLAEVAVVVEVAISSNKCKW